MFEFMQILSQETFTMNTADWWDKCLNSGDKIDKYEKTKRRIYATLPSRTVKHYL